MASSIQYKAPVAAEPSLEEIIAGVKFIENRYTRDRGRPALLKLECASCGEFLVLYQKDGPGRLLRLYRDRIHYPKERSKEAKLVCDACGKVLGTSMTYMPEKRPAIRLVHGAVVKHEVKR